MLSGVVHFVSAQETCGYAKTCAQLPAAEDRPRAARAAERRAMRIQRGELLQASPCADRDTGQRRVGNGNRQLGLAAQKIIDAAQQRAAAEQDEATRSEVGSQFRRCPLERLLDGVDDLAERSAKRHVDLIRRKRDAA